MSESFITFSTGEVATFYAARVPHLKQRHTAEWRGPCPIHRGTDENFAVDPKTGRWFCHSNCGRGGDIFELEAFMRGGDFRTRKTEVFRLVGRSEAANGQRVDRIFGASALTIPAEHSQLANGVRDWQEVERYPYVDRDSNLLFEVVRYQKPGGEKSFRQCRPNGRGGVVWNLDGIQRVPYRLPKLLDSQTVFLAEGERDCATLEAWGLVASCNPGGSGSSHLYEQWMDIFRDRHIFIIPDNDEPGRKHAAAVATALLSVAASIRVVELPNLVAKGDVTDWRDAGGTLEQFRELTEAVPPMDAAALSALRIRWGLADEQPNQPAARADVAHNWPKLEPIQSELPAVQSFSEELLPDSFRPLVADVAERMQVPMDYPAVALVLCLAGAVNRRATIQPKAYDTGWVLVPNLWGGIIAPPGFMKSPVIAATTRPLNQIQGVWRKEHEQELTEHTYAKEERELLRAAWKEQFKAASKKGHAAPQRPKDEPTEPKLRRLIVNDATPEALHQTMSENPAGILVIRDELTGWLSQLDRAGREGERAFCLEAWNGDTGRTIDRIGRGTIHVEACCMSMLGGIQPGRLRSYLVDALEDGPSNDGLIQRFQLLVWPDTPTDWRYVDRKPDSSSEEIASQVLRKLVKLDSQNPLRFRFEPAAQELFVEWLADLESKLRGGEIHPALVSHLSKYRSLMPSLGLLFELADRAAEGFEGFVSGNPGESPNFLVSLKHAQQAAAWCDYLESHARRVYSCVTSSHMRAARELADKIKQRKVGTSGSFTYRDVYLKGWSGLDSPEAVKQAVEVLQDAGWVRELSGESGPSGGRPSKRYAVNPEVWK